MRLILKSALILFLCSGCAIQEPPAVPSEPSRRGQFRAVDLYLSRRSLHQIEFEQFKLLPGKIFKECGKVRNGRQFPEIQTFVDLSADNHKKIADLASQTADILSSGKKNLSPPGQNINLSDPGQAILTLAFASEGISVKTSVDALASPSSRSEEAILKLAKVIRSVAGLPLCRNLNFYGIRASAE